MIRAFLVNLTILATIALNPANAEDPSITQLNRAADQIATVEGIDMLMQTCPADTKDSRISWWRSLFNTDWSRQACEADLQTCADACTNSDNGSACRALARVFEAKDIVAYDLARRQSYTLACTLGSASGCTNRGASLRNAISNIDPYSQTDAPTLEACHTRLFTAACADGDAWGCAMEGQARRLGEGAPKDIGTAVRRLNKACSISSGVEGEETAAAPCRFARRQLQKVRDNK